MPFFQGHSEIFFALFLFCATTVACTSGSEEKFREYLTNGREALKSQEYDRAINCFQDALKVRSDRAHAHFLLGESQLKHGNIEFALVAYQKALELNPGLIGARLRLANLFSSSGKLNKAIAQCETILEKDPQNVDALLISAQALARKDYLHEAMQKAKRAVELDETNISARLLLAQCYVSSGNYDQAEMSFQKAIELDRKSPKIRYYLAKFYMLRNEPGKAENVLQGIVREFPDDVAHSVNLARFYHHIDHHDKALMVLENDLKKSPENVSLYALLARFHLKGGQAHRAEEILKECKRKVSGKIAPYLYLGSFYIATQRYDEALKEYRDASKLFPNDLRPMKAQAQILFNTQKLMQAKEVVEGILQQNGGDIFARILKGRILLEKRYHAEAIRIFRDILDEHPDSDRAHYYKALAHFGLGQENLGRSSLQQALRHNGNNSQAMLLMADIHLREQSLQEAEKLCNRALEINPASLDAHILNGRIQIARKDLNKAEESFQRTIELAPQNPLGFLCLGELYIMQGRTKEAIATFRRALEHNPRSLRAIQNVAKALTLQNRANEALIFCEKQLRKHEGNRKISSFIHSTMAAIHLQKNDTEKAKNDYMQAIDKFPEWPTPYLQLVRISFNLGHVDEAISRFKKIHQETPRSLPVMMNLGLLYQHKGRAEIAKGYYEACLELRKDFAPAANNLAWLLLQSRSDIDRALDLAHRAKRFQPDDPSICDTLGWAYLHKKAYYSAIAEFREALDKLPENPTIHYHLAMAQMKLGDSQKALKSLNTAITSKLPFPERQRALELKQQISEQHVAR